MGVGAVSSKTVVGILSVLFLAAAIGMWAMGGYVIATFKNIGNLVNSHYTLVPAGVMILVGIIFLLGAISGFCAACRESRACSLTFFAFVFLTFALLIAAIVLSFVYKKNIHDIVDKEAHEAMDRYNNTLKNDTLKQIDYLQQQMKCCGSYNYTSWRLTPYGVDHPNHVPLSCCKTMNVTNPTACLDGDLGRMNSTGLATYIYVDGCVGAVEGFIKKNLYYLGAGAIAFLVLLILGMVGSCYVLCQRKESSYFNLGS